MDVCLQKLVFRLKKFLDEELTLPLESLLLSNEKSSLSLKPHCVGPKIYFVCEKPSSFAKNVPF